MRLNQASYMPVTDQETLSHPLSFLSCLLSFLREFPYLGSYPWCRIRTYSLLPQGFMNVKD